MNTTPTTPAATGGLIETLTATGWTHTGPMRMDPQWHSVSQTLEDPDGRLNLDVTSFPGGNLNVALSGEAIRDRDGHLLTPAWMVDLSEWPREAIAASVAAITAATEPGPDLPAALTQAGWEQLADIREAGRLLERSWADTSRTCSVTWAPADQFDDGGWAVMRENDDGHRLDANASQHIPQQVLAALALTDWHTPVTVPAPTG